MTNGSGPVRRRAAAAVLVATLLSTFACSSDSAKHASRANLGLGRSATPATVAAQPARVAAPGAYAVGSRQEVYVDRTRRTKANRSAPALPHRTLPTLVLYPAKGAPGYTTSTADAAPEPGPWPLVVFSHGVTGTGPAYSNMLRVWASAGYVVIAPNFPLSNTHAVGGPTISDVPEQVRDVSFLIDQLLAASGAPGPLSGLIDKDRIGIAGHSLGAITTLGTGYNACCADPRVRAVAEFSGIFFPLTSGGKIAPLAMRRPLLIVHGEKDSSVPYRFGTDVYDRVGPPKFFITLPGQGHTPPFILGTATPYSTVATLGTLDFFDRFLKDDRAGLDRFHAVVQAAGPSVATLKEEPG